MQEDSYWGPGNNQRDDSGRPNVQIIYQSVNRYVYCLSDPVNHTDFNGNVMPGDLEEFGAGSDTYKILVDLGNRWMATDDPAERTRLNNLANQARAMARAGTPFMYGNDVVMNTLHNNTKIAIGKVLSGDMVYLWFVSMTCGDWDYKWNPNWQVPYPYFNGENMNVNNNKNWYPWIYFEGELMSADKFGNLNLGYVGTKMGFPLWILLNPATSGAGDGYWVQKGIDMANGGR